MGHTVTSQRIILDIFLQEIASYGKSLRQEEQPVYNSLVKQPLKHIANISYTSSIHLWAFMLLSVMLEQQKKIEQLEKQLKNESLANGLLQERELSSAVAKNKE